MTKVTCDIGISVDGFVAGLNQRLDKPFGDGVAGRGEWGLDWKGWWGDDPPYHAPVFVLTNHPREPLTMQGGTTFTFVTDGLVVR
jgi:hypothetical protein